MNEQQDKNPDPFWMLVTISNIWGLAIQLPMRRMVGKNTLGMTALLAFVGTILYGGLTVSTPVMCWAGVFFASAIAHRIATWRRWGKEDEPHSYSVGHSWISYLTRGRYKEAPVRGVLEPGVAVLIGILCTPFGDAAAIFFIGGAVCMALSTAFIELRQRRRVDDMRDAMIEGRSVQQTTRKRRW
jgi:hypothetical protein